MTDGGRLVPRLREAAVESGYAALMTEAADALVALEQEVEIHVKALSPYIHDGSAPDLSQLRHQLVVAEQARVTLEQERDAWRSQYQTEYVIVDKVWAALRIATYEQARGKNIAELVSELRQRAEAAEQALARVRAECRAVLAEWAEEVAEFATKDDPYYNGVRQCIDDLKAVEMPPPAPED